MVGKDTTLMFEEGPFISGLREGIRKFIIEVIQQEFDIALAVDWYC